MQNGKAILISCPPGLVFNSYEEQCDIPENFQCPDATTTTPKPQIDCNCNCRYPVSGDCNAFYNCELTFNDVYFYLLVYVFTPKFKFIFNYKCIFL